MVKRIDYLDNLGGLLICYMMLNHILLRGQVDCTVDSLYLEPLQFFMFWFFYKSGMFYKAKPNRTIVIRGGQKLLLPWLIFSALGHVVKCAQLVMENDTNWWHYVLTPMKEIVFTGGVDGNHPLWFLFSLFFVQLLFNTCYHRGVRPWMMVIGGVGISVTLYFANQNLPIYFSNIALGTAVYALGYILRERQFNKSSLLLTLLLYCVIIASCPSHLIFRSNTLNMGGNYLLAIIFSLAGCVLFNNIFRKLPSCGFLRYIGQHSMTFYVTHWIILNLCMMIFVSCLHLPGRYVFLIMIFSCLIFPYLFEKVLDRCQMGWLFGKNNK